MTLQISSITKNFMFQLQTPHPQHRNLVSEVIISNHARSRKLKKSYFFDTALTRGHATRRRCCSSRFGEEPFENLQEEGNKGCVSISEKSSYKCGRGQKDSFLTSDFDYLEPHMLGIDPEVPQYWPEREAVLWANLELKAKDFGLPLSLRMIKRKHQWETGCRECSRSNLCSLRKAISSMAYIVVELQTFAMHLRETLCDEDLEVIIGKVQRDMYGSFGWMFQQVFAQTPLLMINVMTLVADFGEHSTCHNVAIAESLLEMDTTSETQSHEYLHLSNYTQLVEEQRQSKFLDQEFRSDEERKLWDSMQDEAFNMRGLKEAGVDHEIMLKFVSPLNVEIEPDNNNADYVKTDLHYQMALYSEPDNTLLLCNYAQFLQVFVRDYNRAEECFKRAIQVEPPDAESLTQYANFLWTVRKDLWRAEERYEQAATADPTNPYYASNYANFLWSTGGEETCFPPTSTSFNN